MIGLENPTHLLIILVVVLLVFGAKRLPEMGRSLGAGLRGFRDSVSGEPSAARTDQLTPAATVAAEPVAQPTAERV
jgi:sec-independent protein translocase protein TatA